MQRLKYKLIFYYVQVIWKRLYSRTSAGDVGTLFQLRNEVRRSNVPCDPSNKVNASVDFLDVVTKAHIVSAAMDYFKMSHLDSEPSSAVIGTLPTSCEEKKALLHKLSRSIVDKYVNIKMHPVPLSVRFMDRVKEYASETLSLGLFHEEFYDAVKEGDGKRVLRCWRFLLLIFKVSNRHNYSIEALHILLQFHFLLPPCQAQQLITARFVNTSGLPGHNVECDLHMEHLNRLCKDAVEGLGANKVEKAITRVGKCIQMVSDVMDQYDKSHTSKTDSGKHTCRSNQSDFERMLKRINEANVFQSNPGRKHKAFPYLSNSLTSCIGMETMKEWILERTPPSLKTRIVHK